MKPLFVSMSLALFTYSLFGEPMGFHAYYVWIPAAIFSYMGWGWFMTLLQILLVVSISFSEPTSSSLWLAGVLPLLGAMSGFVVFLVCIMHIVESIGRRKASYARKFHYFCVDSPE